jgi:hypothetical protein
LSDGNLDSKYMQGIIPVRYRLMKFELKELGIN